MTEKFAERGSALRQSTLTKELGDEQEAKANAQGSFDLACAINKIYF